MFTTLQSINLPFAVCVVGIAGGLVVGETHLEGYPGAIVWPSANPTSPLRLSDFLPKRNAPFALLLNATAINSSGVIVETGLKDTGDDVYGFVAVPK